MTQFYSRVVTRQPSQFADEEALPSEERISVLVRTASDESIEVGLFNHASYDAGDGGALGFKLPPGADADGFVTEFLDAYTAPATLATMLFGFSGPVIVKHEARYAEGVEQAFVKHLLESNEIQPRVAVAGSDEIN